MLASRPSALTCTLAALLASVVAAGSLLAGTARAAIEAPDRGALARPPLAGLRVAIDPGHNGGNAAHPERLARLVPDGRGGRKACNTTGTATLAGYPEHAAAWGVAQRAGARLRDLGASVTMTRHGDTGVGPCVDRRGSWPQRHGADVLVSLHADGSADGAVRGGHVARSWPPLSRSQRLPSRRLAVAVLASFKRADLAVTRSYGTAGLVRRGDLATLNHARRPAVLVELGQMTNPADARLLGSPRGQDRYAAAIVDALRNWAA